MTTPHPQPPPLLEPPPPPPPEAMLAHAQGMLRTPALMLIGGALLNSAAMALIALGSAGGAIAVLATANGSSATNDVMVIVVLLGIVSLFHFGLIIAEAVVGYCALRMLRTQGWGWAVAGPIIHLIISLIHGTLLFGVLSVLACLISPFEIILAIVVATVSITRLFDPRVRTAFNAIEADPSLLDALRDPSY